jgi:NitT/TauT family transport system permease protein
MADHNYGRCGLTYVWKILVPAAFPSILAGLKIGWAFAWRTLIAAELVFGVRSRSGGLGWFIFEHRNELQTDYVFGGLMTVILIGPFVEGGGILHDRPEYSGALGTRAVARCPNLALQ